MTTGGIFCLGAVRILFWLCSELPEKLISGVGEDGKAVLLAASVMVVVVFMGVFLCFCLVVMTVKSLSTAISSSFGGSEVALADNIGFYKPCFTALVPPWEQCTSAATVTL
jgi:hypothetical protein